MTLPAELEASVLQLRSKHRDLIAAVQAYRTGTVAASYQELMDMADKLLEQLDIEEHTLLGQVARASGMSHQTLAALRRGERP